MASLMGPFLRGENAGSSQGAGLGLTIVATIAQQHGGWVKYKQTPISVFMPIYGVLFFALNHCLFLSSHL